MKKLFLTICITLLIVSCTHKKTENLMHLTGNIKGLQTGKLYVQKMVDTNIVVVETINIDGDSHFETSIDITEPELYFLYLDRGVTNSLDNRLQFIAEPGEVNIETTLDNYLFNAKITGTKNNELLADYKSINNKFNEEKLNLTASRFAAFKANNNTKVDSIDKRLEDNIKRRYLYTVNFALNNKDYEVAPFVTLTEIYDVNMKYLDTIHKSLSPKVAHSLYGKKLANLYHERKQTGE
jgi:Domain of unknown function (DUF4369)